MHKRILATFALAVLSWPLPAQEKPLDQLVSPPETDLPFGEDAFPNGPGVEAINNNCLACHSVDHVMNQPSLSKEHWEEVVQKMVRSYKAPIGPEDQKQIVDYLAS